MEKKVSEKIVECYKELILATIRLGESRAKHNNMKIYGWRPEDQTIQDIRLNHLDIESINKMLKDLKTTNNTKASHQKILSLSFGLKNGNPISYEEIRIKFNRHTPETAKNLVRESLSLFKLRNVGEIRKFFKSGLESYIKELEEINKKYELSLKRFAFETNSILHGKASSQTKVTHIKSMMPSFEHFQQLARKDFIEDLLKRKPFLSTKLRDLKKYRGGVKSKTILEIICMSEKKAKEVTNAKVEDFKIIKEAVEKKGFNFDSTIPCSFR